LKLRIQDNTLRLRLKPSETEVIRNHGKVSGQMPVPYPRSASFRYVLSGGDCDEIEVAMQDYSLVIRVPHERIARWIDSDEVSIKSTINCDQDEQLEVLIEKDFACLVPREGEDADDHFPNPAAS